MEKDKKYGLEPAEFEEMILRLMYGKMYAEFPVSKLPDNLRIWIKLRKSLEHLRIAFPRQNLSGKRMDLRKTKGNSLFDMIHRLISSIYDPFNDTPFTMQYNTSGQRGSQKIMKQTKLYGKIYHQCQEDLFARLEINCTFNKGGRLLQGGKVVKTEEFLRFLWANLINPSFEDFQKTFKGHSAKYAKDKYRELLNLSFLIVFFRACTEMACPNDLPEGIELWETHVDVLVYYALYAIIIDSILHTKWRIRPLKDYQEKEWNEILTRYKQKYGFKN